MPIHTSCVEYFPCTIRRNDAVIWENDSSKWRGHLSGVSQLINGAFVSFFFQTSNAFAAASTVVGTLLGFLAGIYIPIGSLPDYLQTIVKLFPVSHSAALFRQVLMETPLINSFAEASVKIKEAFLFNMGVFYKLNGEKMSSLFSVFYLGATTLVFFILSLLIMKRKIDDEKSLLMLGFPLGLSKLLFIILC